MRLILVLVALIVVAAIASLLVGPAPLSAREVWDGLMTGAGPAGAIIRDIRLPRMLMGLTIGAVLGLSGAAIQGLMRNPLAEPTLFAAPSAAAFGAASVLAFGGASALSLVMPMAGIAAALVSVVLVLVVAGERSSLSILLLAGLAMTSFFGAATALVLTLAPNPYAALEVAFWLLGSLEDRSWTHLTLIAPFHLAALVLLALQGKALRALTLGEDVAASLGIRLQRVRWMIALGTALGVGSGVAVTGAIGFVGLAAPHLVRHSVGSDPARLLLPATLSGAALLMSADVVARLLPSATEVKIGIITALIGVPVFLVLILRGRSTDGGGR